MIHMCPSFPLPAECHLTLFPHCHQSYRREGFAMLIRQTSAIKTVSIHGYGTLVPPLSCRLPVIFGGETNLGFGAIQPAPNNICQSLLLGISDVQTGVTIPENERASHLSSRHAPRCWLIACLSGRFGGMYEIHLLWEKACRVFGVWLRLS